MPVFRGDEALLGGVLKNTADAGMGILDIIDRIFIGLLFGQVNVEYQLGIRLAHQKKEAGSITPYLINQVTQGDITAGPFGYLYLFAAAHDCHHLVQHILGPPLRDSDIKGLKSGADTGNCARWSEPCSLITRVKPRSHLA